MQVNFLKTIKKRGGVSPAPDRSPMHPQAQSCLARKLRIVRDQDEGRALIAVHGHKELHHLRFGFFIEVAGG